VRISSLSASPPAGGAAGASRPLWLSLSLSLSVTLPAPGRESRCLQPASRPGRRWQPGGPLFPPFAKARRARPRGLCEQLPSRDAGSHTERGLARTPDSGKALPLAVSVQSKKTQNAEHGPEYPPKPALSRPLPHAQWTESAGVWECELHVPIADSESIAGRKLRSSAQGRASACLCIGGPAECRLGLC
jgi:hypothetical protein